MSNEYNTRAGLKQDHPLLEKALSSFFDDLVIDVLEPFDEVMGGKFYEVDDLDSHIRNVTFEWHLYYYGSYTLMSVISHDGGGPTYFMRKL
jgi:hypothetical protein